MAKPRYTIPRNGSQKAAHFILEKQRIEKHFPFLQCHLHCDCLICHGIVIPSEGCDPYSIKIMYARGGIPTVLITNPPIEPREEYHMFKEGSLCLYDWREMPWNPSLKIHETIIPWTAEWLVFYEIWKLSGIWLGEGSSHSDAEKHAEKVRG